MRPFVCYTTNKIVGIALVWDYRRERAMSEFKFSCPSCGQHLRADIDSVGVEYRCPACQIEFVVPNPKSATSLRMETEKWIPPPDEAHSAPVAASLRATISLPRHPKPIAPPVPPQLNPLSILAVVFALLPVIGGLPAIVCGHRARREIANNPQLSGRNLATLGMILGYVSLALTFGFLVLWLMIRSGATAGQ